MFDSNNITPINNTVIFWYSIFQLISHPKNVNLIEAKPKQQCKQKSTDIIN